MFGTVAGFAVGAITALVSNFFLGHGPWTPYQLLAWGFLYGWITNTWFWASFIYPLRWKTFVTYQTNSIWFDTFHAIGNGIFLALLGTKTIVILERFRKRFNWINDEKLSSNSNVISL